MKNKKPIPSPLTPSASDLYYDAMELLEGGAIEASVFFTLLGRGSIY